MTNTQSCCYKTRYPACIDNEMSPQRQVLVMEFATIYLKDEWERRAEEANVELVYSHAGTQEEFMEYFRDPAFNIVAIANTWPGARKMGGYSPEMIRELSTKDSLKALCHQGAGYEVAGDIHVWQECGTVQISNTPNSVAPATANTAIFLILAAMRNFYRLTSSLRAGSWLGEGKVLGHEPVGRTLGIIGMGNIGRMIRDRAVPFDFGKIQYYSRNRLTPELEKGAEYVASLEDLLKTSDIIVVAVPLNRHTHHLLNKRTLALCKDGVVIVNIARGPVIDEQALVDALDSGKVASAGLDVFEKEPEIHPGLLRNPDVMLLPHAATFTYETRRFAEREQLNNVFAAVENGRVVNLAPELYSVFPN